MSKKKEMDGLAKFFYWWLMIIAPLLVMGGIFSWITEIPDVSWAYIMIPLGLLSWVWAWVIKSSEENI